MRELAPDEFESIRHTLPDSPTNVQLRHFLRRKSCHVYVHDAADAIVIQAFDVMDEPQALGEDAQAIWDLLQIVPGWTCVLVTDTAAPGVEALFEKNGFSTRRVIDISYVLTQPPHDLPNPHVRLLTPADLPLLEAADERVRGGGFGTLAALLDEGIAAAAIVDDCVVAMANTTAITERYADVGVFTLENFRQRGFSAAATSLVCRELVKRGLNPVWSTGDFNIASQRTAQKVGFAQESTKTYVVKVGE